MWLHTFPPAGQGKKLISFIKVHKHKDIPTFANDDEVIKFCQELARSQIILRCVVSDITKKMIKEGLDPRVRAWTL